MNTESHKIEISNFTVNIIKKDIKNIHLGVYPPNGRVRVAAPLKTTDEAIRLLVISKMPWIEKQQAKFEKQERQTRREYVSGESHYFFGKRYLLNLIVYDSKPKVEINRNAYLDLYVRPNATLKKREEVLEDWYRLELKNKLPTIIEKWEKIIGVSVESVKIRKMKTRWGSCNPSKRSIWVNLELSKKPVHCLEYIVVHEMIHFLEKSHNEKFRMHMISYLPQWKQYKDELNQFPLSHNDWKY